MMRKKRKLPRWSKDVLKELIERDMSIEDLAEEIGIARTFLSGVVYGRNNAPEIAAKINKVLGIDTEYSLAS